LIVLAYIIVFFFALRFLVSLINFLFSPILKNIIPSANPLVSVLIPARNEEKNINNILNDLIKQSYTNIEIIVFNDQSLDGTRNKVIDFTQRDSRINLMDSQGLPKGWLGKNYACYQLAQHARGEYLMFLDADVRVGSGLFESVVAQMEQYHLKLLSIFPKQIMVTTDEKITVPLMNIILLSLLPMILTRISPRPSLAAANGQFMLFEKKAYIEIQPHEEVKTNPVEDILISRLYKKRGMKMQCMTGNDNIRCRMYNDIKEATRGFAKNLAQFFGGNHLAAFIFWLLSTFGIFVVICVLPLSIFFITLALIILMKIFIFRVSLQPIFQNFIYAIPQQTILGWMLFLSVKNKILKRSQWKGRNIY
jgi:glycosyltransferase involved in cell wall biosynthesis